MIAFKISKNGSPICVAGADDLGVLTANVVAGGVLGSESKAYRDDQEVDFSMHIGGLTSRHNAPDDHLKWDGTTELGIGDRIEVEIVEVEAADMPDITYPKD